MENLVMAMAQQAVHWDKKPANFHDTLVKAQSDGAIFWKISNGRGNMPPFQDVFTAEQRWQLVAYIRHLGKTE
jgi:mono/diheme cytochrome c family protein